MSPAGRASIGIVLGGVFAACAAGAIVCHLLANGSPRSEVARRLMEHEREVLSGRPEFYEPEDEMLSEHGLALRARAGKFGRAAFAVLLLIFAWAAWAN
jgi:hypothetical protein